MGRLMLVGSLVFLVMLVLLAPLRLVLGWMGAEGAGLSARRVEGTVWSGQLRQAAFRSVSLGDARVGVSPLRLGFRVRARGEAQGEGVLRLRQDGIALARVDASVPLRRIAPAAPMTGELVLRNFDLDIRRSGCRSARGEVALQQVQIGPTAPAGLRLVGRAACRDGRLVAPLTGQASGVVVDALLSLDAAGRYELVTRLRATDPTAVAAAGAANFERGLDGFTRTDRGRLDAVR
ncbi:type II secretion system protein N [Phenylobacterium sp.]|uniref:type II secretion system protein N n=1 Tax=Phenylobacterium sp. TaxID=1871053 RepID=UPI002811DD26|nr:type II secretion system protein N [Phenylobacterium sp.]